VRAAGSLPVWRRDDETGPMALRITKNGLEAIDVVIDSYRRERTMPFDLAKAQKLAETAVTP